MEVKQNLVKLALNFTRKASRPPPAPTLPSIKAMGAAALREADRLLEVPGKVIRNTKAGVERLARNGTTLWALESAKADWSKWSTAVPTPPVPTFASPEAMLEQVAPDRREAVRAFLGQSDASPGEVYLATRRLDDKQLQTAARRLSGLGANAKLPEDYRREVATEVIRDLANPIRINTVCGPTCSSTSAQVRHARDNPAEYLGLVVDLAQGRDHRLPTGHTVQAKYARDTMDQMRQDGNAAPISWLLFQSNMQNFGATGPSVMGPIQKPFQALANSKFAPLVRQLDKDQFLDNNIVNKDFEGYNPRGGSRQVGHDNLQMDRMQAALFGELNGKSWLDSTPEEMWTAIERDLKQGKSVSASLFNGDPKTPGDKMHVVTILGIDRSHNPPLVHFHTWGEERTLPLQHFQHFCVLADPLE